MMRFGVLIFLATVISPALAPFYQASADSLEENRLANEVAGNSSILDKCKTRDFLKDCLGQLPPILKHTEHGIPTTKKDVDVLCKGFKTGMRCVDEYSDTCLTAEQRKVVENNVMGARYTFKFLCDDPRFQAEYLKYSTCLRGIKDNWDACANQFVSIVKEEFSKKNVSKTTRLLDVCCARHGFINCVLVTTRLKCRKEETIFITKIADTLSNTRVYSPHCKSVNISLCSSTPGMKLTFGKLITIGILYTLNALV